VPKTPRATAATMPRVTTLAPPPAITPPPRVPIPLWKAEDVSNYFAGTITIGTLANWRSSGKGPPYIKMGARGTEVLYRPAAVEAWAAEQERLTMGDAA
jgi:hypothetical protein